MAAPRTHLKRSLKKLYDFLDGGGTVASTTVAGTVKKMPAQVDSVAADVATLKTDFNALLAKMRTAGILT